MIEALADVMVVKGVPEHRRSDNGPEFVARDLHKWLTGNTKSCATLTIQLVQKIGHAREPAKSRFHRVAAADHL